MQEFFNNTAIGVSFGIAIGFFTILLLYTSSLSTTANYNYFRNAIENNITMKQATFDKFPKKYKMDYTDWKDLK